MLEKTPRERDINNTAIFERKGSVGSAGGSGFNARVKSSLMGTSARQKLLKYKLAKQQTEIADNM